MDRLAIAMEDLVTAGLCDGMQEPHLTDKGRDWLEALEQIEAQIKFQDAAEDLVLSTNGLFR
ncbi:MAG: hypothetical protein ACLGIB_09210 [Actinomycetota bacterium]